MSRKFQASLVLNVALAVAVAALVLHKSQTAVVPSSPEATPEKVADEASARTEQSKTTHYTDITGAPDRRRWLVDQLRAAGVPNDVVARVVMSDLEEDWQKRFEEAAEQGHGDADSMTAQQLEHDRSEDADMRAALGDESFKLWDEQKQLREANIGKTELTDAETNSIYDLKKKLQQRQWDIAQARLKGEMDDRDADQATDKAYAEFTQQMKDLLGDERYAKSQGLDEGTAAGNLRRDLAKANPSESQFQDILNAQQEFNKRESELGKEFQDDPSSPDYAAKIKALADARDQEYQRVLGTNAYDALQKDQDPGYSKMKKCESTWGLDDTKVDYVYGSIKYYEKSVEDYQAQAKALEAQGQTVDWDAVNKNLKQFAAQTQQSLQSYLGQDSFDKMQQNGVLQFNQDPDALPHH